MDNMNGIMDVSCFVLVEASGDSELDCEQSSIKQCQSMDMATAAADAAAVVADENDAESCSCDTISTERLDDFYELILQLDDDHRDDDGDADQDLIDCNVWSIDEALVYISADHHEMKDHQEPNTFGVDLCREVIDGMEDRLFWETCMAVGYP